MADHFVAPTTNNMEQEGMWGVCWGAFWHSTPKMVVEIEKSLPKINAVAVKSTQHAHPHVSATNHFRFLAKLLRRTDLLTQIHADVKVRYKKDVGSPRV